MPSILFYLLAAVVLIASLVMVTRRHPLSAAFSLVIAFVALAGIYATLVAPLLAILQILVYAGAIMALVVFVIMLLNVRDEDLPAEEGLGMRLGVSLALMLPILLMLTRAIGKVGGEFGAVPEGHGGIQAVGKVLFLQYGFPFEIISVLLTVAVLGVVVLAKRRI